MRIQNTSHEVPETDRTNASGTEGGEGQVTDGNAGQRRGPKFGIFTL